MLSIKKSMDHSNVKTWIIPQPVPWINLGSSKCGCRRFLISLPVSLLNTTTSVGRKFAPVEGLSHDSVCTGSIYHVHFAWQVWHGQLSPRFKFNKLKSFSGVEIDQNHVDKRILGGKSFAVGRLKRHNYCPASALRNRCCIDTKRCSGGYTQPQVLRLR